MKFFLFSVVLSLSSIALAHDEGHGPKIVGDVGKFGGVLASVIAEADISKGPKAARIYKAEIIRSEENDVTVYIYDEKMNVLTLEQFSPDATAEIEVEVGKPPKFVKTPFKLKASGKTYEGKSPTPQKRPYNIDMRFTEAGKKLFVAFDNLD
jgi:hypothetical protein